MPIGLNGMVVSWQNWINVGTFTAHASTRGTGSRLHIQTKQLQFVRAFDSCLVGACNLFLEVLIKLFCTNGAAIV
uniref:Uncharacterized protein n=1 Tax=Romanomermis culicivorax TaxID=13658 RepID=A0A915KED5_ROMCU